MSLRSGCGPDLGSRESVDLILNNFQFNFLTFLNTLHFQFYLLKSLFNFQFNFLFLPERYMIWYQRERIRVTRIRIGVPEKVPSSFRSGWSPDVGSRETVDLILNTLHFLFYSFLCICLLLLIYYFILLYNNVYMWSTLSLPCVWKVLYK